MTPEGTCNQPNILYVTHLRCRPGRGRAHALRSQGLGFRELERLEDFPESYHVAGLKDQGSVETVTIQQLKTLKTSLPCVSIGDLPVPVGKKCGRTSDEASYAHGYRIVLPFDINRCSSSAERVRAEKTCAGAKPLCFCDALWVCRRVTVPEYIPKYADNEKLCELQQYRYLSGDRSYA